MRISDWSSDVCSSDLLTTISDLHRFAEMLRRGGEIDGVRLLSPAMIRFAARNWLGDRPNMVWAPILSERGWSRFPDNKGLGFRVRGEGIGSGPFGMMYSPGPFGPLGARSTEIGRAWCRAG